MTELEKAIFAVILDCEGCISLVKFILDAKYNRSSPVYSVRVSVEMTSPILVKQMYKVLGGNLRKRDHIRNGKEWKPTWCWNVSDQQALSVLQELKSYLQIKNKQADLCVKLLLIRNKAKEKEGLGDLEVLYHRKY